MSHAFVVMNDPGVEASQEQIPGFSEIATSRRPDVQNMGERGILGTGLKRAWNAAMFQTEIPIPRWAEMFKAALEHVRKAGVTSYASRLDHGVHMSAYKYLLRTEGQLPMRYASSLEIHRNEFMSATAVRSVYTQTGAMWQDAEPSPWMWIHGISSEGAWGAPGSSCMGPDLEAVSEEAKAVEQCVDLENKTPELEGIQNALENGWRIVAVHGSGSHDLRTFAQFVENAIENSTLTREFVRDMEMGLAHGTMVGTPDLVMGDVYERIKDLNVFVPINVSRAFTDEPDVVVDRYGEEALEYLAPVKTLLEEGVKVVGESENTDPGPTWYFEVLNAYVNRFAPREDHHGEGGEEDAYTDVYGPDEGISLVEALKLITIRSAEFCHADEIVGSLEPGKRADYVVIQNDLLDRPDDTIRDNKVIAVALDGELEHMTEEAEEAISIERQPLDVRIDCTEDGAEITVTNRSDDAVQVCDVGSRERDLVSGKPELGSEESLTVSGVGNGPVVLRAFDPESGDPVGVKVEKTVQCD